jgi:hypothetical protein
MNKNIRQDFFLQVKKILDKADKAADLGNHFRAIVLMGDANRSEAYWLHAPQEDMEKLLLQAMRNSDLFAYSAAKALELHYEELKKQKSNDNESDNEKTAR